MKETASFTGKLVSIVLLFAVFFSYAMFQGGFVSWFLFYSFLPLLVYMLLLLSYPISNWKVTRNLSKRIVQSGEAITVDIEVTRGFPFPIYYCIVEEYLPSSMQRKDTSKDKYRSMDHPSGIIETRLVKQVSFPWLKRHMHFHYRLEKIPRGEHHLGAVRIKIGDLFGFINKEHVFPVTDYLLAYPPKRSVVLKEKVSSFEEGASASYTVNMKNTNVVSGVREYAPGDKFSWIDWKTTARKNTVMTKEFEQEKSTDTVLILDAVDYQSLNPIAFEASIELASSLIDSLKRKSSQVAFLSLGKERVFVPFHQDPGKKNMLSNHLARIEPGPARAFSQQLDQEMSKLPQGLTALIIITDINQETKHSIEQLKLKCRRIIVLLIKSSKQMTSQDQQLLQELTLGKVIVNVYTEEELIQHAFEVST